MKLVTLECAGVLPSSTTEETIEHIAETWERGKQLGCENAQGPLGT